VKFRIALFIISIYSTINSFLGSFQLQKLDEPKYFFITLAIIIANYIFNVFQSLKIALSPHENSHQTGFRNLALVSSIFGEPGLAMSIKLWYKSN
jgi:hypothetical protein